jgi:hypothetical protein
VQVLCSRDTTKGIAAVESLNREGLYPELVVVDISQPLR